jgi:hypothetical protein
MVLKVIVVLGQQDCAQEDNVIYSECQHYQDNNITRKKNLNPA